MNVDLNPHFKIIKPIGPRLMGLYEFSMSNKLKEAIDQDKFLEAVRLGVGVYDYHSLRRGSAVGNVTGKLLTYTA